MRRTTKAAIVYNNKFLLILRDNDIRIPDPNTWSLPGGGVEKDETDEEAIKRELKEEINVIPKHLKLVKSEEFKEGYFVSLFHARLTPKEYKDLKLGNEGQEMKFFSLDEALSANLAPKIREYMVENLQAVKTLLTASV